MSIFLPTPKRKCQSVSTVCGWILSFCSPSCNCTAHNACFYMHIYLCFSVKSLYIHRNECCFMFLYIAILSQSQTPIVSACLPSPRAHPVSPQSLLLQLYCIPSFLSVQIHYSEKLNYYISLLWALL